jgi:hypothetical protein
VASFVWVSVHTLVFPTFRCHDVVTATPAAADFNGRAVVSGQGAPARLVARGGGGSLDRQWLVGHDGEGGRVVAYEDREDEPRPGRRRCADALHAEEVRGRPHLLTGLGVAAADVVQPKRHNLSSRFVGHRAQQ